MQRLKGKVAVGLSGGVDSSVAALLLKKGGYKVTGVHMRCWDYDDPGCKGREDRADAIKVAAALNIPLVDLNFEREYKDRVLNYFFKEIKLGRTPNPDVVCNQEIKFGLFLDWALEEGFDYVATGHYARVVEKSPKRPKQNPKELSGGELGITYQLLSGADETKDQSYFLYRLDQRKLGYTLFPIGHLRKPEVRKMAKDVGLVTADKKDSTGICFIGDLDVREFIKSNVRVTRGLVENMRGEVVGEHNGVQLYTVGQRHGFKVTKYTGLPLYVVRKDIERNVLVVGFGKDAQAKTFTVSDLTWISPNEPLLSPEGIKCLVRIRNLGEKMPCAVKKLPGPAGSVSHRIVPSSPPPVNFLTVWVILDDYALGVAPGQSAVFYDGDKVLGGGIID